MNESNKKAGFAGQLKQKLIQQGLERKLQKTQQLPLSDKLQQKLGSHIPEKFYRFHLLPEYQQLRIMNQGAQQLGVSSPFFKVHDGSASATSQINGKSYLNFSSYDYLGMSQHPEVREAAKAAIDHYGTTVSASRIVSGERPIHRELEQRIAERYGCDDALVFVSGHATNVSTIGHLFNPRDLVLHDELIHNSVLQGIQLSGAHRLSFRHNDWQHLEQILQSQRHQFEKVLVVVEGLYSMDGDYPDLAEFIRIKHEHHAFLMVDEAHSFGVLGATGRGLAEHLGLSTQDVDIWMGTCSKALASCGGFIAGETALIEHLRCLAPGFLYSVGLAPALAASTLKSLEKMQAEPERLQRLQHNSHYFLRQAQAAGLDTGLAQGYAIVPVIVGGSIRAAQLSARLFDEGINVQPILYPAVPEAQARLRFFISSEHTEEQMDVAIEACKRLL